MTNIKNILKVKLLFGLTLSMDIQINNKIENNKIKFIKDTLHFMLPRQKNRIKELGLTSLFDIHQFLLKDNGDDPYLNTKKWMKYLGDKNSPVLLYRMYCSKFSFEFMKFDEFKNLNYIDKGFLTEVENKQSEILPINLEIFNKEAFLLEIYTHIMPEFLSAICKKILPDYFYDENNILNKSLYEDNIELYIEHMKLLCDKVKCIANKFKEFNNQLINNIYNNVFKSNFFEKQIPEELINNIVKYMTLEDLYNIFPILKKDEDYLLYNIYKKEVIPREEITFLIISTNVGEAVENETNSKSVEKLEDEVVKISESSMQELKEKLPNLEEIYINLSV